MRLYRSTANSCDAYRPSVSDWTIANTLIFMKNYRKLREGGGKMTYIAAVLAEKYGVCERQVYLIIARFEKDCTDISV
jgi:hypothetical protein